MFYGEYYYRAEFDIPAAYMMRYVENKTYDEFVTYCKEQYEKRKDSSLAWQRNHHQQEEELLEDKGQAAYYLYKSCQRHKGLISTRIEGRKFRIFTKTAADLLDILDYCKVSSKKYISYIHQPASESAVQMLDNDTIFLKAPKYPYRISIREGQYDPVVKQQIVNYVNNHPDSIFISKGVMSQLSGSGKLVCGYFHVNDLAMLTFLKMISHRFVGKIYRLEKEQ